MISWNVQSPSRERFARQLKWLARRSADIVVLSDLRRGPGMESEISKLKHSGYLVFPGDWTLRERNVLVAIANTAGSAEQLQVVTTMPHRVTAVRCLLNGEPLVIVGAYVPSRGPAQNKNVAKRLFQKEMSGAIHSLLEVHRHHKVFISGDLNVVERDHKPKHRVYGEWEYAFYDSFQAMGMTDMFREAHPKRPGHSWFGRSGLGYRFDYTFYRGDIAVNECRYMHEARRCRLSDHSALLSFVSFGS